MKKLNVLIPIATGLMVWAGSVEAVDLPGANDTDGQLTRTMEMIGQDQDMDAFLQSRVEAKEALESVRDDDAVDHEDDKNEVVDDSREDQDEALEDAREHEDDVKDDSTDQQDDARETGSDD